MAEGKRKPGRPKNPVKPDEQPAPKRTVGRPVGSTMGSLIPVGSPLGSLKPAQEKVVALSTTLPPSVVEYLKIVGCGSASRGLRVVAFTAAANQQEFPETELMRKRLSESGQE